MGDNTGLCSAVKWETQPSAPSEYAQPATAPECELGLESGEVRWEGGAGRTSVAMVWPMEVASACISVVLILLRSSADKVVVCPIGTTCCGSFGADMGFDDRTLAMSVLTPSSRFQQRQGSCGCRLPKFHGRWGTASASRSVDHSAQLGNRPSLLSSAAPRPRSSPVEKMVCVRNLDCLRFFEFDSPNLSERDASLLCR